MTVQDLILSKFNTNKQNLSGDIDISVPSTPTFFRGRGLSPTSPGIYATVSLIMPRPHRAEALSNDACLTSVCLSVCLSV